MSERKVLNKYFPPDFDPSKIPRLRLSKERQYTVRLMAPCNMRCKTCGEYIYKGKKFNARKETVQGENYLGMMIFRFYIKCTRCLAEITFKTDPKNTDYEVEHGATRNFQALKLAEEQAEQEEVARKEEEQSNPMKILENRTKASKNEMDVIESLEELQELNERQASVDYDKMIKKYHNLEEQVRIRQEEEDEQFVKSVFGKSDDGKIIKRIDDESSSDDDDGEIPPKIPTKRSMPTDILTDGNVTKKIKIQPKAKKNALSGLVKVKSSTPKNNPSDDVDKPNSNGQITNNVSGTSLGLICCYSDSDD